MKYIVALFVGVFFVVTSCTGGEKKPSSIESDTIYKQGQLYYNSICAGCHQKDGKGLGKLYPPLAEADYLATHRGDLACIIQKGLQEQILVNGEPYNHPMPGNERLSVIDITNILNYVYTSWGNDLPTTTIQQTKDDLEKCL